MGHIYLTHEDVAKSFETVIFVVGISEFLNFITALHLFSFRNIICFNLNITVKIAIKEKLYK